MTYEYLYTMQATGFLDIENIGEVCIKVCNDFYQQKIMIVHTVEGRTKILEYGPVYVKDSIQNNEIKSYFREIDYNDRKIDNAIDKFINDPKFCTTQAFVIDIEDGLNIIKNLAEFL